RLSYWPTPFHSPSWWKSPAIWLPLPSPSLFRYSFVTSPPICCSFVSICDFIGPIEVMCGGCQTESCWSLAAMVHRALKGMAYTHEFPTFSYDILLIQGPSSPLLFAASTTLASVSHVLVASGWCTNLLLCAPSNYHSVVASHLDPIGM